MSQLDTYISENKDTVKKWVVALVAKYVRITLEAESNGAPIEIPSACVCNDLRRVSKCIEVLKYLGIISSAEKEYKSLYGKWEQTYSLIVDPSKIEEVAGAYAKPHEFETKAPDKITDRTYSYPTPESISLTGMIHLYLHPEEYNVYDRMEETKRSRNATGRLMINPTVDKKRVIRIYPKNLEVDAEKAVFWKKATDYFENNIEEAIYMVYGFMPEAISSKDQKFKRTNDDIKTYAPERVNRLDLNTITQESVSKLLIRARYLLAYTEATIRDLEKLEGLVPKTSYDFNKDVYEKAEEYLTAKVPLMINDEDETTRDLATLIMKGSNKGLL